MQEQRSRSEDGGDVQDGYRASLAGTFIGAVPLGSLGFVVYAASTCDPNQGFECLGAVIFSALVGIVGAVVGGALGCYFALRRGEHRGGGATALLLVALIVPAAIALGALTSAIEFFPSDVALPINAVLALATLVALPLGARWLALRLVRRPAVKSDDPSDIV